MKVNTVNEIKEILNAGGSQKIEIEVNMPSSILSEPIPYQKRLIAMKLFGFQLDVVKHFTYLVVQTGNPITPVLVELEFSAEDIQKLALFDKNKVEAFVTPLQLAKPLTFVHAIEMTEKGFSTFKMEFPKHFLGQLEELQTSFISQRIIEAGELNDIFFKATYIEEEKVVVEAFVPNLKEQVDFFIF